MKLEEDSVSLQFTPLQPLGGIYGMTFRQMSGLRSIATLCTRALQNTVRSARYLLTIADYGF